MLYCDSSLVVPILTPERHGVVARRWLAAQDTSELAVSAWVGTEVASALAMKQRRGVLDSRDRARAWSGWRITFATALKALDIGLADYRRAEQLMDAGERGLRAGDALHLAIAERHRCGMATLDRDLADAARAIGLEAPVIIAEA